ncbi:hypothetical protein DPMN_034463 [Dreissena polymorpha]|uniref:Uncharacterized protein n=1 Tax=Dreissena polymorpha TaxID=45954 RepID=A0A9D4M6X4_DREPO|nr:hypothetical protein DPMN_034463 [Dreissena polymorpha]
MCVRGIPATCSFYSSMLCVRGIPAIGSVYPDMCVRGVPATCSFYPDMCVCEVFQLLEVSTQTSV